MSNVTNPVWTAYYARDYDSLRQLAKDQTVDFRIGSPNSNTPLFHRCVAENAKKSLKAILDGYLEGGRANTSIPVAVNQLFQKKTPLFVAAEGNNRMYMKGTGRMITELLLALGADRTIRVGGKLAIDVAVVYGQKQALNEDLLKCLLNGEFKALLVRLKHPEFDLNNNNNNLNSLTLLRDSSDSSQNNVMLLAIKRGSETNQSEQMILDVIKSFQIRGVDINYQNAQHETIFSLAVTKGYTNIVSYLIEDNSLNWLLNRPDGNSVVHLAVDSSQVNTHMLELLIRKKPDLVNSKNTNSQTPLHLAKSEDMIDHLCLLGANPNEKDNLQRTPIDIAVTRSERLADRMRIYNPELSAEARADIVKKYDWKGSLSAVLLQVVATSGQILGTGLKAGAELALTAIGNIAVGALTESLKNIVGKG
jgi:ankyrin repeat protein